MIEDTVNKYLNENKEQDDYKKILKVIQSSKTREHAIAASKMIYNFLETYYGGKDGPFHGIDPLLKGNKKYIELNGILIDHMKKKHNIDLSQKDLERW